MPAYTFIENHSWALRVLVAWGFSFDHTGMLCKLNISSRRKLNSSVNKTVSGKWASLNTTEQRPMEEENRLRAVTALSLEVIGCMSLVCRIHQTVI
ncbi:hypothetical protein NPIL_66931 [Nephila pilipes]|uniref:Uncharacterized protein n=1 Tax=Nephila pilipes TaxID=299642 RepID=A0A8X6JEA5_NEPPI|nr:hypothetical protein NPIL_66931 [Nephila pilipes]